MKTTLLLITAALLAVLPPATAQNPIEGELFPPEFLMAQRETLGLTETQLQEIQGILQEVQQKFETLKGQLEERGKAFQEILHQPKPEIAQAEEKLRAMLTQENEMKILQVHLMLSLRNTLTAEQVDKARQLRHQQSSAAAANDPRQGLAERLGKKFEQLKTAIQERAFEGAPPEEIVKQVGEIQKLAQNGQPLEAERRIDELIVQLREGKKK